MLVCILFSTRKLVGSLSMQRAEGNQPSSDLITPHSFGTASTILKCIYVEIIYCENVFAAYGDPSAFTLGWTRITLTFAWTAERGLFLHWTGYITAGLCWHSRIQDGSVLTTYWFIMRVHCDCFWRKPCSFVKLKIDIYNSILAVNKFFLMYLFSHLICVQTCRKGTWWRPTNVL